MSYEEEVKASHEARIRLLTKYGSFVEVEKLVKLVEENNKSKESERKFSKSYDYTQFALFDRY